ncbi:MAG: hypothetical protein M1838_000903 [Thelocarpon superellum]|nr:MAG: hypothetical protein M1838_000903 [Thelocarpon superellum]
MELTMSAQQDSSPWPLTAETSTPDQDALAPLHGRGYFSELGAVRTKPARADAPRTLSKSCSDKLALKQCTSLLSSVTTLLISPSTAYLKALILPSSQYSERACTRAFSPSGRLHEVAGRSWRGSYGFRPFEIKTTDQEFALSRRSGPTGFPLVASNISAVYTPHIQQTLIGGRLAGRKATDLRGASAVSRRGLWSAVAQVVALLGLPALQAAVSGGQGAKYGALKDHELLAPRRRVKADVTRGPLRSIVLTFQK